MKLKLADLACETFDLRSATLPQTILKLDEISDGCGDLEFRDGLTLLSNLAIRKLLATLEFPLSEGRLYTHHPATMSHLSCEGRIRNGFVGEVRSSIVETEGICVEMEGVKAKAHLIAEGMLVKLDGRGGRVEVGTLTLKDAQCTIGSLLIRLGALMVSGLKVAWGDGRPRIEALRAHAKDLHIRQGSASIEIATIELPEGLKVHEQVEVEQIHIGAVEIAVDDLSKRQTPGESPEQTDKAPRVSTFGLDLGVFDTVNGKLDVDATVAVTLPVIGKRVATHHFRIPIVGGIINYHDFERGLSDLEDAFVDIRLRGDKLVLERDIPIIPGLQKPIITWDLEPGEVELAAKHLVRIRTLPRFHLVKDADEDDSKKSKVRLHRLDFDGIAVHLSLDETGVLASGNGSLRAHVDELDLAGCLHYDPDPEFAVRPTSLGAKAVGLGTVADNLLVAGHLLSARPSIGSVESFQLDFEQLQPTNLRVALKNIRIGSVCYDLNQVSP